MEFIFLMIKESSPNTVIIATFGMILVMIATIIVAVSVISSDKAVAAPSNNSGNNNTDTNRNSTSNSSNTTTIEGSTRNGKFLTYQNSTLGLKIQYPSDWIYTDTGKGPVFIPTKALLEAKRTKTGLTAMVLDLPVRNVSLDLITQLNINDLRQSHPDFRLLESNRTTVAKDIQSQKIVFTSGPEKTLAVLIPKDNKLYLLEYIVADQSKYSRYLPDVEKMINSFEIIPISSLQGQKQELKQQQQPQNAASKSQPATPRTNVLSQNEVTVEGLNKKSNSQFIKARDQYLTSWERSNFSSAFATFVIPNSVNGYGIYDEHRSNIFKPGEPIVLYVEPIGFTHKKLTDEKGNALYNVKLIPSVIISSKNDNKSASIDFPPFAFTSHRKNTEAELTITVTQNTPIPEGEYKILYTIKDAQSNKSFDIIKKVKISNREVV